MSKANDWFFRKTPYGDSERGGVDSFSLPSTIDTFVREVVQNVNDQRVGEQVRVEFSVDDLQGKALEQLLDLIGWNRGLREHLEAVSTQKSHLQQSVRRSLRAVEEGRVRVLTVRDSGAYGLEGDEMEDGNFAMLCRHVLVTDAKSKRVQGGSYGLGKSVLWAFSAASTVLFSSLPLSRSNSSLKEPLRFFGRSYLPSHRIDGVLHQPDGFFGEQIDEERGHWVSSVRGTSAAAICKGTSLERDDAETGTTILIPFFYVPSQEDEVSLAELNAEIAASVQRWFWPALSSGSLSAWCGTGKKRLEQIQTPDWAAPHIRSLQATTELQSLNQPGEVTRIPLLVSVPKRRNEPLLDASDATAFLYVTRVDSAEISSMPAGIGRSVAYIRGAEMVVRYATHGLPSIGPDFVAVLATGRFAGLSASDEALENLLRDSEPPAHDKWDPKWPKLSDNYSGAGRAVSTLISESAQSIGRIMGTRIDSTDAPKKLAELLGSRKRSAGSRKRTEQFQMLGPDIDRSVPEIIRASMTLVRNFGEFGWGAKVSIVLMDENGKASRSRLDPDDIVVNTTGPVRIELDEVANFWSISVPSTTKQFEVSFSAGVGDSRIARMAMATARAVYFKTTEVSK